MDNGLYFQVDEVGVSAFEEAIFENTLTMLSIRVIRDSAFKNIEGDIFISNIVETIEDNAFYLEVVNMNMIYFIEFEEATNAWQVANTNNLKSIGKNAFRNNKLTSLQFSSKIEFIDECAFENTNIALAFSFAETDNSLTIHDKAFANITFDDLEGSTERTIVLPTNVSLGNDVFVNTTVTIS